MSACRSDSPSRPESWRTPPSRSRAPRSWKSWGGGGGGGGGGGAIKSVPYGVVGRWNLYSFFRNPVNHNCCAFRNADVLAVGGYPTTRMEDYLLWIGLLISGRRIFNSRRVLVHADTRTIAARRGGKDYFLAEISLMRLNARRLMYLGSVPAVITFVLRAAMRLPAARRLREIWYQRRSLKLRNQAQVSAIPSRSENRGE